MLVSRMRGLGASSMDLPRLGSEADFGLRSYMSPGMVGSQALMHFARSYRVVPSVSFCCQGVVPCSGKFGPEARKNGSGG